MGRKHKAQKLSTEALLSNHLVVLLSFGCLRLSFELISNGWIGFHRATDSSISLKKKFFFRQIQAADALSFCRSFTECTLMFLSRLQKFPKPEIAETD